MKVLFEIRDPLENIKDFKINAPFRGTGGTLAFPVEINGSPVLFEMNDDCIWEPVSPCENLAVEILQYAHDVIESEVYETWKRKAGY